MVQAYIGLGSNLGDSFEILASAIEALGAHSDINLIKRSRLYQSKAVGPGEQPDYINGALLLATSLQPEALLDVMQSIESAHHRKRGSVRWTARTLDLDLLLYGDEQINSERLKVPHPLIAERNFVLLPLNDLNPSLIFPNGVYLTDLVKKTPQTGITPLEKHPTIDYR